MRNHFILCRRCDLCFPGIELKYVKKPMDSLSFLVAFKDCFSTKARINEKSFPR